MIDFIYCKFIDDAISMMDFILLWEDQYRYPDSQSWTDHVVRVTWLYSDSIRVAVFKCIGGYSYLFYVGGEEVYVKPFGEAWHNDGVKLYTELQKFSLLKIIELNE